MSGVHKVRGRLLEIGAPSSEERRWIFESMQRPEVHVPLGCRAAPSETLFRAELLELCRGAEVRRDPVRYHVLRRLADGKPVGFFVDFGWDHPRDGTREIDLAFPDPADRGIGTYYDATIIVCQYLFGNGLAKRLRWRVESRDGTPPRRIARQGARVVQRQEERHPVTGEWMTTYICEFAIADFERFGEAHERDPRRDYGDLDKSVWDVRHDDEPK